MSVGQSDDNGGEEGRNQGTVFVGVLGLVIGVAAIILVNSTGLSAEKALLGGAYVKDSYRNALLIAGVVLIALSLIVVVLAALRTVDQSILSTIRNVTIALLVGTAIGGGLIYAAYRHEENVLAQSNASGLGSSFSGSSGSAVASGSSGSGSSGSAASVSPVDTNPSDYSSPCALNLEGHDAVVTFTGPNAASNCASFVSTEYQDGRAWQATAGAGNSQPQVCLLDSGSDQVYVNDDGGQVFGSGACQSLQNEGWSAASTNTSSGSTSTTGSGIPFATPSNPIRVDCPFDKNGAVLNDNQPTACFWAVGPGTGAENSPPPNPLPGATYSYDVGASCTWKDAGKNAAGAVEMFTCQ